MTKASNSEQGETPARWDTFVIGSGISGLTAAAPLARSAQRVLVLEQHSGHRAVAAEATGS